jgi:[acyl-carrier-protein] S-malonyltransferase
MLAQWLDIPELRKIALEFSDLIDLDLIHLGVAADADAIKDTQNAQPLIVAAGLLSAQMLNLNTQFSYVAGHSVGEITAAAIAGNISATDAMTLVRERGRQMAIAAANTSGAMAAVLGGERELVLAEISKLGLVAANDNGGGQIVAAGEPAALAKLAPEGARVRVLAVAGAFHSEDMQPAVAPMQEVAATIAAHEGRAAVISNREGAITRNGRDVLDRIVNQIASPVRWDLCMQTMQESGVTGVLELAPAGTLVGLIKRGAPTIEGFALKSPIDISVALEFIARHGGR